ncbi:biotin/lipoyl-containing protein [Baekduia soli]|uniref:biotin/lipoyl-containing protein n=1 Tax=Baekduia soli TaxID=496014 RepID=UPI00165217A9|nr:biotin/lipoyl-containing protein [Baekduia soli]
MPFEITLGDRTAHTVDVARHGGRATVTIDGRDYHGSLRPAGDGYELTLEDRTEPMWILVDGDAILVHAFGQSWDLGIVDPVERSRGGGPSEDVALAPMPGTVISIAVAPGDEVTAGLPLMVIESMKMQSEITAARDGVVEQVFLDVGDTFDRGAALVALEADPETDPTEED